ncbi:ABC transporter ATP-binding protein [Rhodobacteraceae bacterium NNCM2]|nr:ABC transporter ATP-binding protein [Coraliihabitans acroporae]
MTLELRNIVKQVGAETHLAETSLTFDPGGFNILLGATNAGKTTLIKLMAGLEKPTSGRIILDDRDVTRVSPQRRNVSLVHQFFVNYPHMTVWENIASPLRIAGLGADEIKQRVGEAAEILRLTPYLGRKPAELSGGQQQRTALARAIVKDSDLVLLDEPLANLDYKLREELRDQLPRLFADRGAVVVYSTSEPMEALMLGGNTAALHEGRVTQFGPTAEVYRQPHDLTTAEVFSDPPLNAVPVRKDGETVILDSHAAWPAHGAIAGAPDGAYLMGVRPHYVSPTPIQNAVEITGKVQITELSGSESTAHFEIGGRSWVAQSAGVHPYRVGELHQFFIDTGGCLYFGADGERLVA